MIQQFYRTCALTLPIALEGLPVSSSGHVLLCALIITRMCGVSVDTTLAPELDHIVHLPIAIVVALFFLPRWWYLLKHIAQLWRIFFKILFLGFVTLSATAVLYFVLRFVGTIWFPLWVGYAITGLLLFSLKYCDHQSMLAVTAGYGVALRTRLLERAGGQWCVSTALFLGFVQGLALLPGISRLGITYTTARWLGMRPQKAFELSFLIEWPLSVAAFVKGIFDLHASGHMLDLTYADACIMSIASVFAYVGLCLMQWLVVHNKVWLVSLYVACLAAVSFILYV